MVHNCGNTFEYDICSILSQFFVNARFMRVRRIGQKLGLISVKPHEMGISSDGICQFGQKVRNFW